MSSASSGDDGRKIAKDRGSSSVEEADKGRVSSLVEDADKGGEISLKKRTWTQEEDAILKEYVKKHGERNWNTVQKNSGLARCGKSCRFRWVNHLKPDLKKGAFTEEEEKQIVELHAIMGSKWSQMAAKLPGRTDNEIKNFWNTRIKRMQRAAQTKFLDETEIYRQPVSNGDQENLNLDALTNEANQYSNNRSDNITKLPSSLSPNDLIGCNQYGNVLTDSYAALYGNNSASSDPRYGALKVELPSVRYFEAQKLNRHTPESSLPRLVESVNTPESSIRFQPNLSATVSHQNNDGRQRIWRMDESVDTPEPNQSVPVSHLNNDGLKFEAAGNLAECSRKT